jgi:hypothetical protein
VRTHGKSHTAESRVWKGMIQRCTNPKRRGWERYGGRGITVCERWRASFADFLADMGARPSPKHSIDRIDNDGHYEPANCRWATKHEQGSNTRAVTRMLDGKPISLRGMAELSGLHVRTIRYRLARGWSVERTVRTPALRPWGTREHQQPCQDALRPAGTWPNMPTTKATTR